MIIDRRMAIFIGVVTLVAAVLLASGHIVNDDPLGDWLLTGILAVISLAMWIWVWQSEEAAAGELMVIDAVDESPQPQEWLISKDHVEEQAAPHLEGVIDEPPAAVAKPVTAPEPDNLTRIEGIGPKYRDVLVAAGISSFADLAGATLEQIQQVVKDAGMRRTASMATWVEQAKLAASGDWAGLEKLQGELSGGRR